MMRRVNILSAVCIVYGIFFSFVTDSFSDLDFEFRSESAPTYKYDRIDEVKRQCASVLSSAAELKPEDTDTFHRIREELGFRSGDWWQDVGNSPILPFDDRNIQRNFSSYDRNIQRNSSHTPLNLVSFWVTGLDLAHRSKKYVGVNGVLMLGKTLDGGLPNERPYEKSHKFEMWPGHTQLWMSVQGIYIEPKQDSGERVMCLLGETVLPSRESDSGNAPWKWVKDNSYSTPPLLQDDQILLLIHYPKTFTLTNRVIQGELRSLNQKSSAKYFDKLHILSQLGKSARYEFSSGNIVSKACEPYPYKNDSFMNSGIDFYKGNDSCEILERVSNGAAFTIVPNWKCNGTTGYCSKLGPFVSDKEIRATNGSFKDVKLYMQDVHCEQTPAQGKTPSLARVSAVFRIGHPLENEYISAWRSAPNNMTVSAEGIWKPSSGQLCMIGCLGTANAGENSCNTRVCLYIPVTFSIRQRSILVGGFFSLDSKRNKPSYTPLSFEKLVHPTEIWSYFTVSRPHYSYSKIEAAGAILEKNEPFSFGTVIKKSLLKFPKLEDSEDFVSSLSLLSEDLTLHTLSVLDPSPNSRTSKVDFGMDILSLGPLFGRYWSSGNAPLVEGGTPSSLTEAETPYHTKAEYTEKQLLLNVSAQISLMGKDYSNFSVLFLEGLYDEHVGKMYLVGCRDVRASWKILFDSNDLEAGLDCLIEVVVSYPPTLSRWLANPTARISITSQRPEDDPLYFKSIKITTLPITYRRQRDDILSRAGVEGFLRILTLSFAIACITSQLFYIRQDTDSVPFVSLVMLGVQAIGYSLPLITGAEALFRRKASESYETSSYYLPKQQWLNVVDYTVKLLVMITFLLTLRLCQKVWKSRIRLHTRTPLEPKRIPSDRRVLLITLVLHAVGYIVVLVVHTTRTSRRNLQEVFQVAETADFPGNHQVSRSWPTELEEYIGLVQDFFLLPQVFANVMWQIDCRPLRKLYYIGITVVRLLPHLYDYVIVPVPNLYLEDGNEFVNPSFEFYSKFGDIAIPVTAVLLAAVVFVQQRWDYEKLSRNLTFGRFKLLPARSVKYERLPSKPTEAELVPGSDFNGNAARSGESFNEE